MLLTSALIPYLVVHIEDVLLPEGSRPRFAIFFMHPYLPVSIIMASVAFILLSLAGYVKHKYI